MLVMLQLETRSGFRKLVEFDGDELPTKYRQWFRLEPCALIGLKSLSDYPRPDTINPMDFYKTKEWSIDIPNDTVTVVYKE